MHASLQKMLNTGNSRGHLDNNFTFRIRFATQRLTNELHIYLGRELESKSEGKMAKIDELLDVSSSPFLLFSSARITRSRQGVCRISYLDIELKNNAMVL